MTCEHQFVPGSKTSSVTPQGVIGTLIAVTGLGLLMINALLGLVLIGFGIAIGMIGRTKTVVRCAKCGEPAPFG